MRALRRSVQLRAASAVACAAIVSSGCALTGGERGEAGSAPDGAAAAPALVLSGLSASRVVGPPPGHPLEGMSRDAAVSVGLRDGSTLWVFGDTARRDPDGSLAYFVISTAAWASAESSTTTSDAVEADEPVRFASPTVGFPSCPSHAPVQGMWPASAVAVPVGERDRVIVWLANVCLGDDAALVGRGISVAEWWYDPSSLPGEPIEAVVLEQKLFATGEAPLVGGASLLADDGLVYTYGCSALDHGAAGSDRDECFVARVAPEGVADRGAYRYWDGHDWVAEQTRAAPMTIPARDGLPAASPGHMSVAYNADLDAYLMAYSPWPGWSDSIEVRAAERPTGPWSIPVGVPLPGCDDRIGGTAYYCYTAGLQAVADVPGRIGLGWYDSAVDPVGPRGSYFVASVSAEIVPTSSAG